MADEGYGRTFPNDPNPPARAPEAPVAAPAEQPTATTGGGATVDASIAPAPARAPRKEFSAVETPEGFAVYLATDADASISIGASNIKDAADVIKKSGAYYNEKLKSWEGIPEGVAQSLVAGRLPFVENIAARYRAGEASVARGWIGSKWLRGELSLEDALARGDVELLKMQAKGAPAAAWNQGFAKFAADLPRRAVGAAAEMVPFVTGAAGESALDAAILGTGGLAIGAAALGAAGLATPAAAAGVAGLMNTGAAYGVFKYTMDIEAGNAALDMTEKGFDEVTVRRAAPTIGALKGALEIAGFRFLAAPFKRVFLEKILTTAPVKAAIAKWYVSYMKETGAEVTVEVVQDAVEIGVKDLAALASSRPDLLMSGKESFDQLFDTFTESLLGLAVIKAPGAGVEAGSRGLESRAEGKKAAALAERKAALEALIGDAEATPQVIATPGEVKTVLEGALSQGQKPEVSAEAPPSQVSPGEQGLDTAISGFEAGEASASEVVQAAQEAAEPDLLDTPEPQTLESKVHSVEVKGRLAALEAELKTTIERITEVEKSRARFEKAGMPTARVNETIETLTQQGEKTKQEIERLLVLGSRAGLEGAQDPLLLRPATLEDIVAEGVKEGRGISKAQAKVVKGIASENRLTVADIRGLLRGKIPGSMGDVEFRNWLGKFKEDVALVVERKGELSRVGHIQAEKLIEQERNIRLLHKLPAKNKMTTEQLRQYADILSSYDAGVTALPPKRVRASEQMEFKGARTWEDVRDMAAYLVGQPVEAFAKTETSELDVFKYDTYLSREGGFKAFMVQRMRVAQNKGLALTERFEEQLDRVAAAAIASRRKLSGAGERVADWLAPQQELLVNAIEAAPEKRAALMAQMTDEERAFVEFALEADRASLDYLQKTRDLQTRFEGIHVFHTTRPVSEMLRDLPDQGLKKTLREVLTRWKTSFEPITQGGGKPDKALGLKKHLKAEKFRTGELTPSKNLVLAMKRYYRDFFRAVALDEAVPAVETAAMAARVLDKSPDAEEMTRATMGLVREYLNAKGGNAHWVWQKGGVLENTVRALMALTSLKYIAANYALQVAAPVGETTAEFMVLGSRGIVKAKARKMTKKGRAVIEKYRNFAGKSPWAQIKQPGRNVEDNLNLVLYGMFQATRHMVMGDVLLGSMTDAEWEAGAISDDRLAQIQLNAGRWLDIHGAKSIRGSSVQGAEVMQFKGWVVPPMTAILGDLKALAGTLKGDKMTPEQVWDFVRLGELTLGGWVLRSWLREDDEEDFSFRARAKRYIRREMLTMLAVLDPRNFTGAGVAAELGFRTVKDFVHAFIDLVGLLVELEDHDHEDGSVGARALKRDLTPAVVKPFLEEEE